MAQFTEEFVPMNDILLPSSFALTAGAGSRLTYWLRTAKTAQCKIVAEFGLPCVRRSQGTKGIGAMIQGFVLPLRLTCASLVCSAVAHIYQATTYKAGSNCTITLTSLPLTQTGFSITKSVNDNAIIATINAPVWDNTAAVGTFDYIARVCFYLACASVTALYRPRALYADTVALG